MESTPELFERLLWHPAYSPVLAETVSLLRRDYPLDMAATYYASPVLAWVQLCALVVTGVAFVTGLLMIRRAVGREKGVPTWDAE